MSGREYWMIYRGQASSRSYDLAPHQSLSPPLPSVISTGDTQVDWEREATAHGRGGRGWAMSRIIRPQEILALYKSLNTLRCQVYSCADFLYTKCTYYRCNAPTPVNPLLPPPPTCASASYIYKVDANLPLSQNHRRKSWSSWFYGCFYRISTFRASFMGIIF